MRIPMPPIAALVLAGAALAGAALAGCAASPATPDAGPPRPEQVRTVYRGADGRSIAVDAEDDKARDVEIVAPATRVWEAVPLAYQRLGLQISESDPTTGTLSTVYHRARGRLGKARLSSYLDCGTGALGLPNADNYQVNFQASTTLFPDSVTQKTTIRTRLRATAKPDAVSGDPVACLTTGTFERLVGEYTTEALALVKKQ